MSQDTHERQAPLPTGACTSTHSGSSSSSGDDDQDDGDLESQWYLPGEDVDVQGMVGKLLILQEEEDRQEQWSSLVPDLPSQPPLRAVSSSGRAMPQHPQRVQRAASSSPSLSTQSNWCASTSHRTTLPTPSSNSRPSMAQDGSFLWRNTGGTTCVRATHRCSSRIKSSATTLSSGARNICSLGNQSVMKHENTANMHENTANNTSSDGVIEITVGALAVGGIGTMDHSSTSTSSSSSRYFLGQEEDDEEGDDYSSSSNSSSVCSMEGLVVANPVDESDDLDIEDMPQAVAVQQPLVDSGIHKPRRTPNHDICWAAIAVIAVLICCVIVGTSVQSPTTKRNSIQRPKMKLIISNVLGKDYFQKVDETDVAKDDSDLNNFLLDTRLRALDWIVTQDPLQLEYNANNLVQRFILVLFYFQTTRYRPWRNCNAPPNQNGRVPEFCYQPGFKDGHTTSHIWGLQWLSNRHECQWAGVSCETKQSQEKKITELALDWNDLNGPLPWETLQLGKLRRLQLKKNGLTGLLPPKLFSTENSSTLESLTLVGNQLSGTLPGEWFTSLHQNNGTLRAFVLSANKLTGTIPSEIGLIALRFLLLEHNSLSGSIPNEIFHQTGLEYLSLHHTNVVGTLSTKIGLMKNLYQLTLSETSISGSLPSDIGLLSKLQLLDVSNTRIHGTLPNEIYSGLGILEVFDASGCTFSGTISSKLGLLTNLSVLSLDNNQFHGTIPKEIDALEQLTKLRVNGNDLSGSVPVSVCHTFQSAFLEVVADCLPNEETGVSKIHCAVHCCTSCCDQTGLCLST